MDRLQLTQCQHPVSAVQCTDQANLTVPNQSRFRHDPFVIPESSPFCLFVIPSHSLFSSCACSTATHVTGKRVVVHVELGKVIQSRCCRYCRKKQKKSTDVCLMTHHCSRKETERGKSTYFPPAALPLRNQPPPVHQAVSTLLSVTLFQPCLQ